MNCNISAPLRPLQPTMTATPRMVTTTSQVPTALIRNHTSSRMMLLTSEPQRLRVNPNPVVVLKLAHSALRLERPSPRTLRLRMSTTFHLVHQLPLLLLQLPQSSSQRSLLRPLLQLIHLPPLLVSQPNQMPPRILNSPPLPRQLIPSSSHPLLLNHRRLAADSQPSSPRRQRLHPPEKLTSRRQPKNFPRRPRLSLTKRLPMVMLKSSWITAPSLENHTSINLSSSLDSTTGSRLITSSSKTAGMQTVTLKSATTSSPTSVPRSTRRCSVMLSQPRSRPRRRALAAPPENLKTESTSKTRWTGETMAWSAL